ncbi:hypothetical protein [Nocardioides sp. Iso805N]|uniref:hypothetical protein n=1 Tax=Nocardioides sp. Iso805N TaxID=1283287 RepID=UPI000371B44C|nr:hypothetical protein [Nocardioides sp. Iso805N]
MTSILGSSAAATASVGGATTSPPSAVRATRPGWRDPRLWIGIAIIAACVVVGVRVLGAADDTVAVWSVKADAGAGATLSRADLEVHRVHFAAASDLAGYYRADAEMPTQVLLARAVGHGELLPRSAVSVGAASDTVQVPLAVDPAQVPPAVASGSVIDVYVVGASGVDAAAGPDAAADSSRSDGSGAAASGHAGRDVGGDGGSDADVTTPVLSAVTVVSAPRPDDAFGSGQSKRQLILAMPEKRAQEFFGLLAGLTDPTITVVLRPAG